MQLTYELNQKIIDHAYQFGSLHTKLDQLEHYPHWYDRLKKIIASENSIAAVSIDEYVTRNWAITPRKSSDMRLMNKETLHNYEAYLNALHSLQAVFKQPEINIDKLTTLHKLLIPINQRNNETTSFRSGNRSLIKYVLDSGIIRSFKIDVKTPAARVPAKLEYFCSWFNDNLHSTNPVTLAAITHYQIAEIHPFQDGNGRLARLLEKGLFSVLGMHYELLMLEDYYLQNREEYYDLLDNAIKSKDMTNWFNFYSKGLVFAINRPLEILYVLTGGAIDLKNNKIIDLTPREIDLVELFNEAGQLSAAEIGKKLKITRQSANTLVKGLLKKKMLDVIGKSTSVRYRLKINSENIKPLHQSA